MKKSFSLILLSMLVCLSFCSCSNDSKNTNAKADNVKTTQKVETTKAKEKAIKSGDVIKTDYVEITINNVELSYDVKPEKADGFYTHYAADKGKVYICVTASVKNIGKQNISCDEIADVTADYNKGYKYKGFSVVEDSSTGFTYSNISEINPLETKTMKYLIDCPQEVETSKAPLLVKFNVDGKKYIYTIR